IVGFLLLIVIGVLVKGVLYWQHHRGRREAFANYARLERALQDPENRAAALAELAELLKQLALTAFPGAKARTLTGPPSWHFLDQNRRASQLNHDFSEVLVTPQSTEGAGEVKGGWK